jgi:hypothetical protein
MKKMSEAANVLLEFIQDVGSPAGMHCDGQEVYTMTNGPDQYTKATMGLLCLLHCRNYVPNCQ